MPSSAIFACPGTSGIDGLRKIREIDPHVAVIMLTGFGALETAKEALRLGANDYISKPFDAREMREVIGRNVERTRVQRTGVNAAAEIKELNNRLLKELAQKERLASLGQASAEFVHDLGNPLTIVWGYVQLLAKKLEQSEKENGSTNPNLGQGAQYHRAERAALPGAAHDVAELRERRGFAAQADLGHARLCARSSRALSQWPTRVASSCTATFVMIPARSWATPSRSCARSKT